jgi:uncharacterized ferredoxin-like protein
MNDLKVDFLYICHRKKPEWLGSDAKFFKKAQMVKLVDTLASGTSAARLCKFESCSGHQKVVKTTSKALKFNYLSAFILSRIFILWSLFSH